MYLCTHSLPASHELLEGRREPHSTTGFPGVSIVEVRVTFFMWFYVLFVLKYGLSLIPQAGLQFMILLPQSSQCWDCGQRPYHSWLQITVIKVCRTGNVAGSAEFLQERQMKPWAPFLPQHGKQLCCFLYTCNPSAWEVEAKRKDIQGNPWPGDIGSVNQSLWVAQDFVSKNKIK